MDNYISNLHPGKLESLRRRAQNIRMCAMDLDGTLLDSKHRLSDENRLALKALADRGVILAAATGRARTAIYESVTSLPGLKYLITANGSKLYLNETNEIIYKKFLSIDAVNYLRSLFSDSEVLVAVCWGGTPHVEEERYAAARDFGIPMWFSDYFYQSRKPIKDLETAVSAHVHEIENIIFVFPNELVQERVYTFIKKRADLYAITSSFPFNYEIGGIGVSKAAALDFVAKREGIIPGQIISFGDNDNDLSMIEYAGIGIAVANATPKTLAAAEIVTESCDDSGVAAALKALSFI